MIKPHRSYRRMLVPDQLGLGQMFTKSAAVTTLPNVAFIRVDKGSHIEMLGPLSYHIKGHESLIIAVYDPVPSFDFSYEIGDFESLKMRPTLPTRNHLE